MQDPLVAEHSKTNGQADVLHVIDLHPEMGCTSRDSI